MRKRHVADGESAFVYEAAWMMRLLERPIVGDESRYDALRAAIRAGANVDRPIWVCGGGTLGERLPSVAVAVSAPALSEPVGYWPEDMVIRVPAGMTLARAREVLAARGQELSIDAADPARTTIGGLVASGICGSRRLSRGSLRDLLIGLTIVDARGDLLSLGGRVVKNVAGYDLCKLLIGSWGWLAAIVEATFRVRAKPEASRAIVIDLGDVRESEELAAKLLGSPLSPASLDLLDGTLARRRRVSDGAALVAGFEGLPENVNGQLARVEALLGRHGRTLEYNEYSAIRQDLSDMALGERGHIRAAVPSGQVVALVEQARDVAPGVAMAAHAGSGVVLFDLAETPQADRAALIRLLDEMSVARLIPRPVAGCEAEPMARLSADARWMLRKVKNAIDPQRVFGRGGRFDAAVGDDPAGRFQ
ncbi:MAG: FAD-binding oxidoreductase [Phycisphaerales bacterium]|nr:FAD-binding oxidoreductase [Phycisphaerales bacterium]